MKKSLLITISATIILSGCSTMGDNSHALKPNYSQAYKDYLTLGARYLEMGRYDLAEPKLKRAIEIDSQPPEAWNALALLYEQKRDIASGYKVYEKLIASHPDYELGFTNFATFLCKFNRNPERAALYQRMHSKGKPFITLAYIAEGNCAMNSGNPSAAATAYQQALQYNQYAAGALIPLAEIAMQQHNPQLAQRYIKVMHTYVGYTPESVAIGVQIARALGNRQMEDDLQRMQRAGKAQATETPLP